MNRKATEKALKIRNTTTISKEKMGDKKVIIKRDSGRFPSMQLIDERDIALDFSTKVYRKFDKLIKSIVLFGSSTKNTATSSSDIDLIVIIDDVSIQFDQELIAWYREEIGKIISANPYKKELHINTVKLSTWWQDLIRGDPVVVNVIRFGDSIIDFGGFFAPLKILLAQGKIKSTPESIYMALERAPSHLAQSRIAELSSIEGVYWAMVDSSQAALMAASQTPPSPEHIPIMLKESFVDKKLLSMKYVVWYRDLYVLHRRINHGEINNLHGTELEDWQSRADEFVNVMAQLVKKIIS